MLRDHEFHARSALGAHNDNVHHVFSVRLPSRDGMALQIFDRRVDGQKWVHVRSIAFKTEFERAALLRDIRNYGIKATPARPIVARHSD